LAGHHHMIDSCFIMHRDRKKLVKKIPRWS